MLSKTELQCKYLGGFPDLADTKRIDLLIELEGLVAVSWIMKEKLFLIPWAVIRDIRQRTEAHQETSASGGLLQAAALFGAGRDISPSAPTTLAVVGAGSKRTVREHLLDLEYEIQGIKGVCSFKFEPIIFFNKYPAARALSLINNVRIKVSAETHPAKAG